MLASRTACLLPSLRRPAGNALIILYGPAEVTFTLEQLRRQWATPAMTTFLVVLGGLLCLLHWLHWRITGGMTMQPQPQLVATLEGGGNAIAASNGSGRSSELPPDAQQLLAAGSGKWVNVSQGGVSVLAREQDAVSVFVGALLFSAVASFVGAWSVLFSKSMTYVVSYLPASLTDWWVGHEGREEGVRGGQVGTQQRVHMASGLPGPSCRGAAVPRFQHLLHWNPTLCASVCHRYSWFILAAFLGTAAFWVRQSDRGLRNYPASLIMPLMQVGIWGDEVGQ